MTLKREQRGDVHVWTPQKNLMGGEETDALRRAREELIAQGTPRVVIDLGQVSWMNSCGLGVLVAIHVSCATRGGWLRIARVGQRIKSIFLITWLVRIFDTYDTVQDALAGSSVREVSGAGR
jgi:anti-sigma B factor antagonist